ncbi:thiosulfate oxidation carrier protein SoxY [Candidatus Marithrix sp. Canyon 246]|uniref:thiosulfate oxidation carrier protein SoxY n=2 Tax=Candidatus Marithrix sp. Canyon 246 TaxID=1827136 RepID=UPI00084A16BB|nr:thiosulfate oxidation carrier protein SoxY [Candidatus Marithrix sp. Canyon 246]
MSLSRRTLLKSLSGILALALPSAVMAKWPQIAFESKNINAVLKKLYPDAEAIESSDIIIKIPNNVENGRFVPVEIQTNLANVESISIISETNPAPLLGEFKFADNVLPWIKTRVKISKTGNVIVMVKTKNQLYTARKQVTVNLSGCI